MQLDPELAREWLVTGGALVTFLGLAWKLRNAPQVALDYLVARRDKKREEAKAVSLVLANAPKWTTMAEIVERELTQNGGQSMRDRIAHIEQQVAFHHPGASGA